VRQSFNANVTGHRRKKKGRSPYLIEGNEECLLPWNSAGKEARGPYQTKK